MVAGGNPHHPIAYRNIHDIIAGCWKLLVAGKYLLAVCGCIHDRINGILWWCCIECCWLDGRMFFEFCIVDVGCCGCWGGCCMQRVCVACENMEECGLLAIGKMVNLSWHNVMVLAPLVKSWPNRSWSVVADGWCGIVYKLVGNNSMIVVELCWIGSRIFGCRFGCYCVDFNVWGCVVEFWDHVKGCRVASLDQFIHQSVGSFSLGSVFIDWGWSNGVDAINDITVEIAGGELAGACIDWNTWFGAVGLLGLRVCWSVWMYSSMRCIWSIMERTLLWRLLVFWSNSCIEDSQGRCIVGWVSLQGSCSFGRVVIVAGEFCSSVMLTSALCSTTFHFDIEVIC